MSLIKRFNVPKWEESATGDVICKQVLGTNKPKVSKVNKKKHIKKTTVESQKVTKLKTVKNNTNIAKAAKIVKKRKEPIEEKLKATHPNSMSLQIEVIKNPPIHYENKETVPTIQKMTSTKTMVPKKSRDKMIFLDKLRKCLDVDKDSKEEIMKKKNKVKKNRLGGDKSLRAKMVEKLKAARFRYLNEQMYTNDGTEAMKIFQKDPQAFKAYHEGYHQQMNKWPLNPIDRIIKSIQNLPESYVIADFGCGEAKLAKSVKQKVHSFDFVASNNLVTPCNMAKVPLKDCTVDVAIFCLSLMGTNLGDYLMEANRVLKIGGLLKIAEVESRFETVDAFIKGVEHYGFKKVSQDLSHNLFYFIDFKKETNSKKKGKLPSVTLHPCLYKKR